VDIELWSLFGEFARRRFRGGAGEFQIHPWRFDAMDSNLGMNSSALGVERGFLDGSGLNKGFLY